MKADKQRTEVIRVTAYTVHTYTHTHTHNTVTYAHGNHVLALYYFNFWHSHVYVPILVLHKSPKHTAYQKTIFHFDNLQ